MRGTQLVVLHDCVVLRGHAKGATLRWVPSGSATGVDCGNKRTFLIGPPPANAETTGGVHAARRATVQDLTIEAVALRGCAGILGANGGAGFTMRNLDVNAFADMAKLGDFASVVQISDARHFLIEGCTFLHCGNSTGQKPGDQPIMQIKASSDAGQY